jgi:hypothetical protein
LTGDAFRAWAIGSPALELGAADAAGAVVVTLLAVEVLHAAIDRATRTMERTAASCTGPESGATANGVVNSRQDDGLARYSGTALGVGVLVREGG